VDRFDICIIGAGVVGLAIAYQLSHTEGFAKRSILLIDSLPSFGQGTSSRNSEVIHGGIYYPPGSLKAKLCIEGKSMLYRYLVDKDIPHRQIGKLIVAQSHQRQDLERIHTNAAQCGMKQLQWLDETQLNSYEPAVSACYALYSPTTGIVDSHAYMASLLHECQRKKVLFVPNTNVLEIQPLSHGFKLTTDIKSPKGASTALYEFKTTTVINAAGLTAHLLAQKVSGIDLASIPKIHYCKGDYFSYGKASPFSHLIYPVPDANTTGLGVHSTLDLANQLKFGPDTEYISCEQYKVNDNKRDAFAAAIKSYFPALLPELLTPAYAGIRPKLSGPGEPAADFMVQTKESHGIHGLIQLFGIESPGLTASLAMGSHVIEKLKEH
jgi:L-2-hydroxyglutarate oxidase LhgO